MKLIVCKFKEPFGSQDKDLIMSKGVIPGNSLIMNRSLYIQDWDDEDPQETCEFWNTELQDILTDNILVEVIAF